MILVEEGVCLRDEKLEGVMVIICDGMWFLQRWKAESGGGNMREIDGILEEKDKKRKMVFVGWTLHRRVNDNGWILMVGFSVLWKKRKVSAFFCNPFSLSPLLSVFPPLNERHGPFFKSYFHMHRNRFFSGVRLSPFHVFRTYWPASWIWNKLMWLL